MNYNWSTGSILNSTEVQNTGWYSLQVSEDCATDIDSVYITVLSPPIASINSIYTLCEGQPIVISPNLINVSSLQWSDGTFGNTLNVSSPGTYSLIISNNCFDDTLNFDVIVGSSVSVSLPMDIDTCLANGTILLTPIFNGIGDITWSNGQTFEEINVSTSGVYWVQYSNGCFTDFDSINVVIDENTPMTISTNVNDPACELTLNLSVVGCDSNSTVTWNTGVIACNLFIDQPGEYIINYSNSCGNFSDTLLISNLGDGGFYVPNTFTPNGDEFNNQFQIYLGDCYDSYIFNFELYNRWGEIVFESTNSDFVWDGTFKGNLCQDGTYTWKINLKKTNTDEKKEITGHLNIIK